MLSVWTQIVGVDYVDHRHRSASRTDTASPGVALGTQAGIRGSAKPDPCPCPRPPERYRVISVEEVPEPIR